MNNKTPILVGSAQYVDRHSVNPKSMSPTDISSHVSQMALLDASISDEFKQTVDVLISARLFEDSVKGTPMWPNPFGGPDNVPGAIARRIGLNPRRLIYAEVGGETPQRVVNQMAEQIFSGDVRSVVFTGSEALATIRSAQKKGLEFDWTEEVGGNFEDLWPENPMTDEYEAKHGITFPIQVYALLEQVRRHRLGLSLDDYREGIANLLSPFSVVAEKNPYAQFPKYLAKEYIANFSEQNFPLCEPYAKWMVAQDAVNQGAAVVMTSVATAIEHDIPESQWVYLKSYSDCDELRVIERPDLSRSPAQQLALTDALDNSGLTPQDFSFIDLYSCFPIAIWTACESLGLSTDGSPPLTVTGGLPYFGGPGNNYSLHAISEITQRLRGKQDKCALVAANGGYLSKHSVGVYSSDLNENWKPLTQRSTLGLCRSSVKVKEKVSGRGIIESYAAVYSRGEKKKGFIVGKLVEGEQRFLAVANPEEPKALSVLFGENPFGEVVEVDYHKSGLNLFSVR